MSYSPKTKNTNTLVFVCAVLMLVLVGCRTSTWSSKNITGDASKLGADETASQLASTAPTTDATLGLAATANSALAAVDQPSAQQQAATPQQIMADVRELGTVNPAAQAALMQELEKADPDIWPSVVQNFRSRLAYGDRLHNEEMLAARTAPQQTVQDPRYAGQNPRYAGQNPRYAGQGQNPHLQYASKNPYYANQPITTSNAIPYQTPRPATTGRGSFYENHAPPNQMPQNYSAPLPLPSSPNQPAPNRSMPVYPRTSAKQITSKVIQASYKETIEEVPIEKDGELIDEETGLDTDQPTNAKLDWRKSLTASIESLQQKLESAEEGSSRESDFSTTTKSDQLRLRLMLLAAGRSTEATEPISGESEAMTDFWAGQMFGLGTLINERKASNPMRQNALAKHKLSEALDHLGKASDLEVRNLSFCKAVNGFANIEPFDKYEFRPGDQVILYAELDNLKHEETVDGYRTSLEIGYKIFDSADHPIENQQSNASEECSPVLRRDYYVSQLIRLPERLYPGRHLLKLTVEDRSGKKYGESVIEFVVK